ncbi:MAG: flippase [Thermoplasmata archaeon]|nr:flippase [Thermoplasmata archaeon]
MVTSLAIARTLGVEQYGIYVFAFAFPGWFVLIMSLGLDSVVTIDVAADRSKASSYLTAVATLRIPLVLIAMLLLGVFLLLLLPNAFERNVAFILGLSVILEAYSETFKVMFRAFERMEFLAFVNITRQVITTGFVLSLLVLGFGILEASLVFLLGSVSGLALSMAIVKMKFVWIAEKVDILTVKRILKRAVPFALSLVVIPFLYSTAPVFLTILADFTATGTYNAAFALMTALLLPFSMYAIVFLPAMGRMYATSPSMLSLTVRKTQKLFFMVCLPIALGGWFFAEDIIVLFYGEAFRAAAASFGVLILLVALYSAMLGTGTALAATGHQRLNLYISVVGAAINIGLCLALIPSAGPVGAALAFFAAHIVMTILTLMVLHRAVDRTGFREALPKPILSGIVMLIALYGIPGMNLWAGLIVAPTVYFSTLLICRGFTVEEWTLVKDALKGVFTRREPSN